MNAFALGGLLTFIISVIVVVAVLLKHPRHTVHNLFIFLTIAVGMWGFCSFRIGLIEDQALSLLWWKIAHVGIILVPVFFFHFIFAFVDKKEKWPVWTAYGFGIFFLITLIQGHLIKNVEWVFDSFYYDGLPPTILYVIFTVFWWVGVIYAHTILFFNLRKTTFLKREQTKYLFLAVAIAFSGGLTCFLPVFGLNIYPFGNMLIPLYPIISGYAIVRHHLLDINIVIKKGISYSIVITFITTFYFLVILLSEKFFQGFIGYNSNFMSLGIVLVIAILFTPLKDIIQRFVDMRFFKGSLPKLAEENIYLRQEVVDKEKFKAVSTLASGLAHEIKNPLTAIKTFTEYMPLKKDDPEFIEKFSRIVGKEVTRINDLVHQLLDFAKPSAAVMKDMDMHELINETLDFLSNQWVGQRIKLTKNFDHTPLVIHADSNQLRQVFLNLFSNAIEAMPKGGTLTVETEQGTTRDPQIVVTIADTGSGIAPETLKNLFNPFYTTKEKGTGLGLSVSKTIIENHKGRIKVESNVGKGTKFVIELPTENN